MPATKYSFPEHLDRDEDSRVSRSLMMARLLFEMNYDVYGNELMQRVENCRFFRTEVENLTGKPFPPSSGQDTPQHAWNFTYIAALCYTAGKLEATMPEWLLAADFDDGRHLIKPVAR